MASKQITPFQLTDQFTMDNFNQRINETNIALQSKPNPNLLDNWYFANCVDQRGGYVVPPGTTYYNLGNLAVSVGALPSYATVIRYATYDGVAYPVVKVDGTEYMTRNGTAVRGYTGAGYGIDRWKAVGDCSIILNENYIEFVPISTYNNLRSYFENPKLYSGKTVTISALVTSDDIYDALVAIQHHDSNGTEITDAMCATKSSGKYIMTSTVTLPDLSSATDFYVRIGNGGSVPAVSLKIHAIKLELGSQQTLAHQDENGVWQLNEIPDYGEQLRRCQRYHFEFGPSHALIAYDAYGVNSPVVYFPVQMRTGAAIKVYSKAGTENAISYWNGSADVDFTDFYLEWNENFVVLRSNGKFTPGGIYTVGKLIAYADL